MNPEELEDRPALRAWFEGRNDYREGWDEPLEFENGTEEQRQYLRGYRYEKAKTET